MKDLDLLAFTDRGTGTPLVLVHGLMVTGEMFSPVLDALSRHYRVIVPDLRGHGRSRGLPPPYHVRQHSADLARLLDHLAIDSVAVLGYSQGGAVAQQFVLDHPRWCRGLVLCCTYAHNMATVREKIEGHLVPWLLNGMGIAKFAKRVVSRGLRQVEPARADWLRKLIADQNRELMVRAWREAMGFDSRSRLGEIRCPTLVVAGSRDEAVPLAHARQLHHGIPGSRLVVVEGADHALIWSRPAELARLTHEFLESSLTPSSENPFSDVSFHP